MEKKTLGLLFCWGESRFCCCGNASAISFESQLTGIAGPHRPRSRALRRAGGWAPRHGRASAWQKGLAEKEPGGQAGKETGAEEGALPRDPQVLVVALTRLVQSSGICQRAPCWRLVCRGE